MGDQRLAPPAAGLAAEADLETGGDVTGDHLATEGVAAGVALDALGIDAPGLAAEGRLDDDPLATPVAAEHLPDDLVAGDEGGRGQRREVERRPPVEQGVVGPADPRQPRGDADPFGADQGRRIELAVVEAAEPGTPRDAGGGIRGGRRAVLEREHQAPTSSRASGRFLAPGSVPHSRTGQCRRWASLASRKSGLIATGWPTSWSIGRSEMLSP